MEKASDIVNFAFEDLTVEIGTKKTWTNRDGVPHTTTSGQLGAMTGVWRSADIPLNGFFSFTFNQLGTFKYYCEIHPTTMKVTVTVVQSLAQAPVTPTFTPSSDDEQPTY